MKMQKIGEWSFIAGVVLAILSGFFNLTWVPGVLIVLGFLVGFLNITEKETESFLLAAVGLLLVGSAGLESIAILKEVGLDTVVESVLTNIRTFTAPGVLVVALKTVWELAKKR